MQETVSKITGSPARNLLVSEIRHVTVVSLSHCGLRGWVLGVKHSVVSVKLKHECSRGAISAKLTTSETRTLERDPPPTARGAENPTAGRINRADGGLVGPSRVFRQRVALDRRGL